MRYSTKYCMIEAEVLSRENGKRLAEWCGGSWIDLFGRGDLGQDISHISIRTLEGTMRGNLGDFIVKGLKGEFYPCKPDAFEAKYEPCPHLSMVCGVDCQPGDNFCNNYCNSAPQNGPMASKPPPGPDAQLVK